MLYLNCWKQEVERPMQTKTASIEIARDAEQIYIDSVMDEKVRKNKQAREKYN